MRMWFKVLLFLLLSTTAWAGLPPTRILDEGTDQGVFFKLDCVGAGISCTQSGITGTMTVSGSGSATITGKLDDSILSSTVDTIDIWTGLNANINPAGELNIYTQDSEIVHDSLSGFVSNEHIDHTSVTLTAGAGLSGGGDISSNRSFATASGEADFLASGALTCGASTQGKAQVHTTPLQYCDNAGTPALQYAAYGDSSGNATGLVCTDCVAATDLGDEDFGDFTCADGSGGCTLDADVVAAAEMADADHGQVSWSSGVATVEDMTCTDCINATEIEDIYVLNSGDTTTGDINYSDGVTDSPKSIFTPQTGTAWDIYTVDSDDDLNIASNTASTENIDIANAGAGVANLTVDGTVEGATLTEGGNAIFNASETPGGELGGTWSSPTVDDTGISLTSITIGALLGVDSIDATGAVDMDYGSADVTDHTFITDGGTVIIDGSGSTIPGNIEGEDKRWIVSIFNGNSLGITTNSVIPIGYALAALTVTNIRVETSSASYEIAGDVKYADARIGLANATVINVFDTASGVLNDSTITSAAVASGKFVYIQFDSAPNASDTDDSIVITWDYD